jgi:hypothetical protein
VTDVKSNSNALIDDILGVVVPGDNAVCQQHKTDNFALASGPRGDDQGPGQRILRSEQAWVIKTEQTAPGHNDPNNRDGRRHIALHGLLPHRYLKFVQSLDLQAAEPSHCLNGLGLECIRDHAVDRPSVRVSELGRDLVVGMAGGPELNSPYPAGSSQGSIPVSAIHPREFD